MPDLVIFLRFNAQKYNWLKTFKANYFPVIKLLNVSNLSEFHLKQFGSPF